IANNPEFPSFENTIEAMEKSGRTLDRIQALFGVMTDNMSTPAYQALDKEWSPKLSAAYDKINLNSKLFARIATVNEHRDHVGLDAKQMRLLTRTYEGSVRRGAKLNDAQKAQLSDYNQQLATDFSEFNSRLLADEATFTQASEADMAGVQQDGKGGAGGGGGGEGQALPRRTLRDPQHSLRGRTGAQLRHQPRAARKGVACVRQPRRQWRCQRHQCDHRQDREAAGRPCQAARLCQPCRMANAGHDGQVPGQGDGTDDAGVEAGRRAGP